MSIFRYIITKPPDTYSTTNMHINQKINETTSEAYMFSIYFDRIKPKLASRYEKQARSANSQSNHFQI